MREIGGTLDNFTFIARIIGLNPRWLATGDGAMWLEDEGKTVAAGEVKDDGLDDLVVVIEELLALLARAPAKKAKTVARQLAAVAKDPPQVSAEITRTDAIRISVRAILRALQGEAR